MESQPQNPEFRNIPKKLSPVSMTQEGNLYILVVTFSCQFVSLVFSVLTVLVGGQVEGEGVTVSHQLLDWQASRGLTLDDIYL